VVAAVLREAAARGLRAGHTLLLSGCSAGARYTLALRLRDALARQTGP
jgi:hypothetical protein